jgi:hypothetical protein
MQDIHWSAGLFGYFPTYTLGNLYAAQFFARAEADLGPLEEKFAGGDFAPLLAWLRDRIHSQGHRLWARPLVREVTGVDLQPSYLVRYLQRKFGALYGLPENPVDSRLGRMKIDIQDKNIKCRKDFTGCLKPAGLDGSPCPEARKTVKACNCK